MLLSGADILVKTLIEQGCDTVFGYPGGQILNVYDSLYTHQDQIHHILTAHEQGATHAADGYARTTGKVGVVISTSGPGATNLVTGIATAYLDSIPMVAICGNVPTTQIGTDSFQELDITGVTLPITKHNYFVGSVEHLADTIREAFVLAKSGRPGPVLVDVPKDVQIAKWEYETQPPVEKKPPHAAKDIRITEAAKWINSHREPYPRLPAPDQLSQHPAVLPFPFCQFLKHHAKFTVRRPGQVLRHTAPCPMITAFQLFSGIFPSRLPEFYLFPMLPGNHSDPCQCRGIALFPGVQFLNKVPFPASQL